MELHDRWDRLCERVGAFAEAAESDLTFEMLRTMYEHPPRAYHNLEHIGHCLGVFDGVRRLAEEPDCAEFAIWLHECVFFPERSDNEARSADAAGMVAGLLGCPPSFAMRARELILWTRHDGRPDDGDGALVADIDLSVLGEEPGAYDAYRAKIVEEYAFAEEELFWVGRKAFLERMLGRERLFQTAYFFAEREKAARANMERELGEIEERWGERWAGEE